MKRILFAIISAIAVFGFCPVSQAQEASAYVPLPGLTTGHQVTSCGQFCLQDGGPAQTNASGHTVTSGTAPGVGSGSGDCGTSPAIVGNDNNGRVTVGSSTNGGKCTLTFATAWTHAPQCSAQDEVTGNVMRPIATATTLAITGTLVAGDTLVYRCADYN